MSDRDAVSAEVLREQLMAVPGVASADVEVGSGSAPAGVKVKLAPDADARRVGAEVQRLLAARGMRSRFSEDDPARSADEGDALEASSSTETTDEAPKTVDVADESLPPQPVEEPPGKPAQPPPRPDPEPPAFPSSRSEADEPEVAPPSSPAGLRSVAVEERADGLGILVTLEDGRSATRDFTSEDEDLDGAVIAALAEAIGADIEPVATEWLDVDGGSVVTVVLRRAGRLVAGAGVVRVGRAFAVGMAAHAALSV